MLSDIEIIKQSKMNDIESVALKHGLTKDDLFMYGKYKHDPHEFELYVESVEKQYEEEMCL